MKPLNPEALAEVQNLAAEASLDPETALAHAAELRELRKLRETLARQHRLPLPLIRANESLPAAGDTAAYKRALAQAMAAEASAIAGAADLAQLGRR